MCLLLRLTLLIDDNPPHNKALRHSHGLSILLERDGDRVLFDCGADGAFMYNAHRLGISLDDLAAVVISHGHYDHAGGFLDFMDAGCFVPKLYAGKGFSCRKYSRSGRVLSSLAAGWTPEMAKEKGIAVTEVCSDLEILPGIHILYGFQRLHKDETIPERYVIEKDGVIVPDDFSDEITLAVETEEGIVLIAGCSHPGIMNIVDTAEKRLGHVAALVGGIHLAGGNGGKAESVVGYLKGKGISFLGLCHCSGREAERLTGSELSAGDSLVFG